MKRDSNIAFKLSKYFLLACISIAFLAPFLANETPILSSNGSGLHVFSSNFKNTDKILLGAPIPYSASSLDLANANGVSPFEKQDIRTNYYRHWLGTDELGRDVLANLIHGCKTALLVGFGSMLLAAIIGILLGCLAAYFGDGGFKMNRTEFWFLTLLKIVYFIIIFCLIPWGVLSVSLTSKLGMLFSISSLFISIGLLLHVFWFKKKSNPTTISIPIDLLIGRLIEIMESIPLLFLIIALSAILQPSIYTIILIIGVSAWAGIARYARAETLKIMQLDYVASGKALGYKPLHVIWKHIIPNALGPILVSLAFGVAAAILIETTLSFIGLGVSASEASWGQLIAEARGNHKAWWLAIFPGLAIFFTVLSCHIIGDKMMDNGK